MKAASPERNSLLRLFGSPREVIAKAERDLGKLRDALSIGHQREALWALMDCSTTVFHVSDWIRATHTDHDDAARERAARSPWIRMTRDICHAAKHGDLTWKSPDAQVHGPVLAKLQYVTGSGRRKPSDNIIAIDAVGIRHDVVDVLNGAIAEWSDFVNEKGI